MVRSEITQQEVRALFDYRDGELYRKTDSARRRIGERAGSSDKEGYTKILVNGLYYKLHRLVWLYHHGDILGIVDHIDQDPRNNRIENLRMATKTQNNANGKLIRVRNTSGFRGVSKHSRKDCWRAEIQVERKRYGKSGFGTPEAAAQHYDLLAKQYFGAFAALNFPELL